MVSPNAGMARVLNQTDPGQRKRFAITLAVITGDSDDDLESCRLEGPDQAPLNY